MSTIVVEHTGMAPVLIIDFEDVFNFCNLFGITGDVVKHGLEFCLNEKCRLDLKHPDIMTAIIIPINLSGLMFQEDVDTFINNGIWIVEGTHEDFNINARVLLEELDYHVGIL